VRIDKGSGYLMVCDTVPRNYFFIFFSTLEFMVSFFNKLLHNLDRNLNTLQKNLPTSQYELGIKCPHAEGLIGTSQKKQKEEWIIVVQGNNLCLLQGTYKLTLWTKCKACSGKPVGTRTHN
jgi:hypothetical protein